MKRVFSALLCVCIAGTISAAEISERLASVLSAENASALVAKGQLQKSNYRGKGVIPCLAPSSPLAHEAALFWSGKESSFFVETLYLYKKKKETDAGAETERISAVLRSLSKLQGIEYYSTSRKKMRTLYEKSYTIDSVTAKNRIPDPINGSADGLTLFALQKDLTFGECVYRYSYRQTDDSVAFFSLNLDTLSYTVIKVVNPEKLHVSLVVQDLGDYLLVYALTRADFLAIPGLESKINASFTTRAEAVYQWFIKEYEKQ